MSDPIDKNSVNKIELPNAGGILTLGILSIVFSLFIAFIGLILGIIGISMANKATNAYNRKMDDYTESSYKQMKAGKICSIVGVSLSGLAMILYGIIEASKF